MATEMATEDTREDWQSAEDGHDLDRKENGNNDNHHSAGCAADISGTESTRDVWLLRAKLLFALSLPVLLETLDYTVVATSQTRMASYFDNLGAQAWIGTAYLLTATTFLPIYGSIADVFGRHWALQFSLGCFMLGSALSTGAQSMAMLLIGRAIAGIGAAGLTAVVRVILSDSNNVKANQIQSTMFLILYTIGYAAGPVLGGALATVTWRWCFGINLPICAVGIILTFLLLRKLPNPSDIVQDPTYIETSGSGYERMWRKLQKIDYLGAFLFISGIICILLGLNWGGQALSWDQARIIGTLVGGSAFLFLFCAWQVLLVAMKGRTGGSWIARKGVRPILPMNLFKSMTFVACNAVAFASGVLMFGLFYFVATYFIIVQGVSPTNAGIQLLYFTPGVGGGSVIANIVIARFKRPKWLVCFGAVIMPISAGLIAMSMGNGNTNQLNGFMALAGVGCGVTFMPVAVQLRFAFASEQVAVIASNNMFFRMLGGVVGLSQMGAVLNSKSRAYIINAAVNANLNPTTALAALSSDTEILSLEPPLLTIIQSGIAYGSMWSFYSIIPWLGAAALLTPFIKDLILESPIDSIPPQASSSTSSGLEKEHVAELHDSRRATEENVHLHTLENAAPLRESSGFTPRPKRSTPYTPLHGLYWCVMTSYDRIMDSRDRKAIERAEARSVA